MDVADRYQVARGWYGPAFQGLRPCGGGGRIVRRYLPGVPIRGLRSSAVLDAALHAWGIVEGEQRTMLPFSAGVCFEQAGLRSVCDWRRWWGRVGGLARSAGLPVLSVRQLMDASGLSSRVVEVDHAGDRRLLEMIWTPVEAATLATTPWWELPPCAGARRPARMC